jgi:xanthine dehydrogenase accessory factor
MLRHDRIATIVSENHPAALCLVTETSGSTPRKAGARMVVFADGTDLGHIEGTIGGGVVEHEVRIRAVKAIATLKTEQFKVALTHELGMCCGGQMTIYIEPLRERSPCLIFGAGHIALALGRLAAQCGFELHICDPREELLNAERLPFAAELHKGYSSSFIEQLPLLPDTFIVIATHSHQTDQELVEALLAKPFRYLALVGSKRKALMTRERCLNKGFSQEMINRVHCPAGLDIKAETPEEIAVSILAQMIQTKRGMS